MKSEEDIDRIEDALLAAHRKPEPLQPSPDWQDRVMAEIRARGPLTAAAPLSVIGFPKVLWEAAAVAAVFACCFLAYGWYEGLSPDAAMAGLIMDQTSEFVLAIAYGL